MPPTPVFNVDLASVKAALRLTEMPVTGSGTGVLYEAMRNVRLGFLRELGLTVIQTLQSYSLVDDPDTEQETLRALAAATEIKWLRYELSATMPTLFMEGPNKANETWNEEAPFRHESERTFQERRMALWLEIQENLSFLSGDESLGDNTQVKASTFGAETENIIKPGQTLWPLI